ncbi:hypothetical protein [Haloplanus sp. C73]|uniref:RPA family protein n=1 Tax=Haloplanus sp. C73 TaxID=3421641 RepID=UPI003EBD703F
MSASDDGPGRREVAHRLFAAEFDDATVSYAESDEERAPKYVVTPTGARVNRLFTVGVLTEIESVNEDVLRARVVDPTGAFVSYAGQYQPDAAAFFERAEPPAFVALTGKARTFEPDDGDRVYTSVRPESVSTVDAETRDRWTVSAAEATLRRVAAMADAHAMDARGDELEAALLDRGYDESLAAGIPLAIDRYGTTVAYLDAVREVALDALAVVAGERDAVRALDVAPDDAGTTSLGPLPEAVQRDTEGIERTTPAEPGAVETDETDVAEPTESTASAPESRGTDEATSESVESTATADESPVEEAESTTPPAEPESSDEPAEPASTEPEPTADEPAEEAPISDAGDTETADETEAPTGELGDFEDDDLYELDEEERREVESEFDVGFESGAEVGDPGEADIDVPGPEDLEEDVGEVGDPDGDAEEVGAVETADGEGDETTDEAEAETAEDVDLEVAAVEVMDDLDEGDGVAHDKVVAAVVEEYGADPGAVADAIEDALMSGKCYEPSEDRLKAI